MKTLPTLLLCLAGAAAGAGLGWLLRGAPPVPTTSAEHDGPTSSAAASGRPRKPGETTRSTDQAANELETELARRQGPMRWLSLLGAVDQATAADMPALLRSAKGLPGATRLLASRWAALDPRHMFDALSADYARHPGDDSLAHDSQVRSLLFETWANKDPEAAIAALNDLARLPGMESERFSMANTIIKTDPARGLKLMNDWNITGYIPDLNGLAAWVEQSPRTAAEVAMQNNLGMATKGVMEQIGKAWAAQDPAGALTFAESHHGLNGIQLAQAVMSEWAQRDLATALAHVSAQGEAATKAKLGLPLIEAWAKSDPQAA